MSVPFEFTETAYREMIRFVKNSGYKFVTFYHAGRYDKAHVLLRHDIDMSPHRAARISQIEAEEDVQSTYFVHLHSCFYNAFEESAAAKIYEILDNGHACGIHYDPGFYKRRFPKMNPFGMMLVESTALQDIFNTRVSAISFHNPSLFDGEIPFEEKCVGDGWIINAHSSFIRGHYTYCSDSNSVWNYAPIDAISQKHSRLHILTHPEWWTDVPMSRTDKVERCIVGRCENQRRLYNLLMEDVYGKTY